MRFFPLLGFIQLATDLPQLPIGRLEQISIVALETAIIWILWRAYREKDNQLADLTKKIIETDTQQLELMRRVDRLLESLKQSGVR